MNNHLNNDLPPANRPFRSRFILIMGALLGLLMLTVAVALLIFSERETVKSDKTLEQGKQQVHEVAADRVDSANEGRLVYLSGQIQAAGPARDPELGISAPVLRLIRQVRIYQWQEERALSSSKYVKRYKYTKVWSENPIDSRRFSRPAGHENPPFELAGRSFEAPKVRVGAFLLSSSLLGQIQDTQPLAVTKADFKGSPVLAARLQETGQGLYLGKSPQKPEIGDLQISFATVPLTQVSVVAGQHREMLGPFQTPAGSYIEMLMLGQVPRAGMFETSESANAGASWFARGFCLLLMLGGFWLSLRPFVDRSRFLIAVGLSLLAMGLIIARA